MGLLSAERLAKLKPSAFVVNTARAALTDEDALFAMLQDGRLAGAALDVLRMEPLQPDNRFFGLDNVIVTPHIGGATVDVTRHQSDIVVDASSATCAASGRDGWRTPPSTTSGARSVTREFEPPRASARPSASEPGSGPRRGFAATGEGTESPRA
jgi:hypothetical protein